jgi:polysaccharide biosynthesis protein PslG
MNTRTREPVHRRHLRHRLRPHHPHLSHDLCHACLRLGRRLIVPVAAVGAVAAVSLPAPVSAASPDSIRVTPRFFGLHDGSQQAYGRVSFGSLRIWDAGATWRQIETSPGHYDWSRLDTLVRGAQQHGVRVMLVLGMTPSFYADQPSLPPSDLTHFTDYVRAVMQRYRSFDGRRGIGAYEVWNEGNVSVSWTGSPHQLAELTRLVDRVRNQVDPDARVVAPSFATRLLGQRRWFSAYQDQRVDGHPVWHYYDANALSLYPKATYGRRVGTPEDAMRLLGLVRNRLHDAGVPSRIPIWDSEVNYGVKSNGTGPKPADPISQSRQVANVLRTYLLGAANGLARVYWYRYDWGQVVDGHALANTLLSDPNDASRITPAGRAVQTAERWLNGRLVSGRGQRRPCASNHRGTYTCIVRSGHRVRTILWNPRHTVRVRVHSAVSRVNEHGRSTAMNGRATTMKVGYRPVMLVRHR